MPSNFDSRIPVVLAILSGVIFAYSLIIAQQLLLGFISVGLIWFVYVCYLLARSLSRIATALERIATQRAERRGDVGDATNRDS